MSFKLTLRGHTKLTDCPDCQSSHIGGRCGSTFRNRLRSVRLDPSATPTRTKVAYYDSDPIHRLFGEDAHEEMMEDTEGLGPVRAGTPEAEKLLDQAPEVDDVI